MHRSVRKLNEEGILIDRKKVMKKLTPGSTSSFMNGGDGESYPLRCRKFGPRLKPGWLSQGY